MLIFIEVMIFFITAAIFGWGKYQIIMLFAFWLVNTIIKIFKGH